MGTFTSAVIKFLLATEEKELPETVRLWYRVIDERLKTLPAAKARAEVEGEFAHQLWTDMFEHFGGEKWKDLADKTCELCPEPVHPAIVETYKLIHEFLDLGFSHVNFRRVAKVLMRRFRPAEKLAGVPAQSLKPSAN